MSAERVLVDTSVWVDYFKGDSPVVSEKVDRFLSEADVCVPQIVLAELIQGAKSDREVSVIEDIQEAFTIIDQGPETWMKAGKLSRRLRSRGKTIHLIDCYIAVIADESRCALLTLDDHFQEIRKVLPLRLL